MKYTSRDYEGFRTDMIKLLTEKLPEYTDTTSSDAGIVILELFAYMLDMLSYYIDVVAGESLLDTAVERGSVMSHVKTLGYKIPEAKPSKFYQVFEITPQETDFVILAGRRIKTNSTSSEESVYFETDTDLTIPAGNTGLETDGNGGYLYKVSVTQGYTIEEDILGTSLGTKNQMFKLNFSPVISDSIKMYVNEGTGYIEWNKVDNFIDSAPNSPHYEVVAEDNDDTYILFGDDASGKIPNPYTNGLLASYRVGGGVIGNVGAMTITEMEQSTAEIVQTFNPDTAFVLGEEPEENEEAKVRAVANIRSLWRAVTLADFEDLALAHLQVLKAKAIKGVGKVVDVYLLPKETTTFTIDQFAEMQTFYEERKLLGVTVNLYDPVYVELNPTISVKVHSAYNTATHIARIKTEIDSILKSEFFVQGHYGFGQTFVASELTKRFMDIEGVKSAYLYEDVDPLRDVDVEANEIITLSAEYDPNTSIQIGV